MHLRRIVGSIISTALVATPLALISTASPASAATATQVVSAYSNKPWIYPSSYRSQPGAPVAGSSLSIGVQVTAGGGAVYAGHVSVQRRLPGQSWKTIVVSEDAYLYRTISAVSNASYRVVYSGGDNYQGSFSPSTSVTRSIAIQRKLTIKNLSGRKAGFKGTLKPAAKVKITVLKKHGRKYKRFKVLRSSTAGRFKVVLPAPRRGKFHWKIIFAGNRSFVASTLTGYTYRHF